MQKKRAIYQWLILAEITWNCGRGGGKINGWELYFKQPAISMEDAYRSRNVRFPSPLIADFPYNALMDDFLFDETKVHKWNSFIKKYYVFNDALQKYVDCEVSKVIKDGRRILGCSIRMGYVQANRLQMSVIGGHPKQPDDLNVFITDIQNRMLEWNCDYVFLSTDDEGTIEELKKCFKDQLLCIERKRERVTHNNEIYLELENNLKDDLKLRKSKNFSYLAELTILSKCQCYICATNGGALLTSILNDNEFEHKHVYQLGYY